jgi:hypothetical protein
MTLKEDRESYLWYLAPTTVGHTVTNTQGDGGITSMAACNSFVPKGQMAPFPTSSDYFATLDYTAAHV